MLGPCFTCQAIFWRVRRVRGAVPGYACQALRIICLMVMPRPGTDVLPFRRMAGFSGLSAPSITLQSIAHTFPSVTSHACNSGSAS